MTYTPQIYPVQDRLGNIRDAEVQYDTDDNTYVGAIRSQKRVRMFDGSYRGKIMATGVANTPEAAASNAILNFDESMMASFGALRDAVRLYEAPLKESGVARKFADAMKAGVTR